jgi:hypothetical protein
MGDTSLSSYFQVNERGQGDNLVRKPGKMFVVDPSSSCSTTSSAAISPSDLRPASGAPVHRSAGPDTFIEATAKDMGFETIRWGSRRSGPGSSAFSTPRCSFFVWISSNGVMLRLEQPEFGMLVER